MEMLTSLLCSPQDMALSTMGLLGICFNREGLLPSLGIVAGSGAGPTNFLQTDMSSTSSEWFFLL